MMIKMNRLKKLISQLPQNWEITTIFFTFLTIALFLGDGLQPIVDIYVGICLSTLGMYALWFKKPQRTFPQKLFRLWLILLVYYGVRTIFSDSVGLSISATMRLLMAAVAYYLFYIYSDVDSLSWFCLNLIFMSILAITCSFVLILIPHRNQYLPSMNLLYADFGHNHLPSLLLFTLPFVYQQAIRKGNMKYKWLLLFYLLALTTSFAKGVLLLLTGYFGLSAIFALVKNSATFAKTHCLFLLSSIILLLLFLLSGRIFDTQPFPLLAQSTWYRRQTIKSTDWFEVRGKYWQQAGIAFLDQPIFGHGQGTFFLLSKRYERTDQEYSYFAHSSPMELLAETGLIGLTLWILLICKAIWPKLLVSVRNNNSKNLLKEETYNNLRNWLMQGLLLSFGLSLVDFNLNFLINWLIVVIIIGILTNSTKSDNLIRSKGVFIWTLVTMLSLYSLLYLISSILSSQKSELSHKISFYLTPFDRLHTLEYINSVSTSYNQVKDTSLLKVINFFHQKDADILFTNATILNQLNQYDQADMLFKQIVIFEPRNLRYNQEYLKYIIEHKSGQELQNYLSTPLQSILPQSLHEQILTYQKNHLEPLFLENDFLIDNEGKTQEKLAKIFYRAGLRQLAKDARLTKFYWTSAEQIAPGWSYFFIENASLSKHNLLYQDDSRETLQLCLAYSTARKHCEEYFSQPLPLPGFFEKNIQTIPNVITE